MEVLALLLSCKEGKEGHSCSPPCKIWKRVDDHQLQLIKQFDDLNLICTCYNTCELANALEIVKHAKYKRYQSNTCNIIESIDTYISTL